MRYFSRRFVIGSAAAGAAMAALPAWAQANLVPTPRQTEGPFYPRSFPVDVDADLVQVAGRSERARGTIAYLAGKLVTPDGKPVAGGEVEIWQCDAGGVYHHVGSASRGADPNFQGYGKAKVAADGTYRFRTIKPIAYPGRTPHIHAIAKGQGVSLTTQLYVDGEPQNERDGLFRAIRDPQQRASVLMKFRAAPELEAGALIAETRIVLQA